MASVILVGLSLQPQFKKGLVFVITLLALCDIISSLSSERGDEHCANKRMLNSASTERTEFFMVVVV